MHAEDRAEWNRLQASEAPEVRSFPVRTRTRKGDPIPCHVCRQPIEKGQRYRSGPGIVDGKFEAMKYHVACPGLME